MKLTTSWMQNNYRPALAGINEMTNAYYKALSKALQLKHPTLFPEKVGDRLYSYTFDDGVIFHGVKGFAIVSSVGCGKYKNIWDPSNWDTHAPTPEQIAVVAEADIPAKVKAYRQELVAGNTVMQLQDKAQRQLAERVRRADEKVRRAEEKSGFDAGEWMYNSSEGFQPGSAEEATYDMAEDLGYGTYWHEYVELYEREAIYIAEALLDNAE